VRDVSRPTLSHLHLHCSIPSNLAGIVAQMCSCIKSWCYKGEQASRRVPNPTCIFPLLHVHPKHPLHTYPTTSSHSPAP